MDWCEVVLLLQQIPLPAFSPCCTYIPSIPLLAAPCSSEMYRKSILPQLPEQYFGIMFSACWKTDQGLLELCKAILHSS